MLQSQTLSQTKRFTTRRTFKNQTALLGFARKFLRQRIMSLNKDVKHCLREPYAPFPAILYCFSTIDLLGALYQGQAEKIITLKTKASGNPKKITKVPQTVSNSRKYMKRFMNYDAENIRLLQEIFRHKTVHLSQPKPVIIDKKRAVGWKYYHQRISEHLKLRKLNQSVKVTITTPYEIWYNFRFSISIMKLTEDISRSVFSKPDGYFEVLSKHNKLQGMFKKAINEIYNPTLVK